MDNFAYEIKIQTYNGGYDRIDLPQVNLEHISHVVLALADMGIGSEVMFLTPNQLNFTQKAIDSDKITDKIMDESIQYKRRFFLVSSDMFLVDGQHDMAYALEIDPNYRMFCFVFNCPIVTLIELLNEFDFVKNSK